MHWRRSIYASCLILSRTRKFQVGSRRVRPAKMALHNQAATTKRSEIRPSQLPVGRGRLCRLCPRFRQTFGKNNFPKDPVMVKLVRPSLQEDPLLSCSWSGQKLGLEGKLPSTLEKSYLPYQALRTVLPRQGFVRLPNGSWNLMGPNMVSKFYYQA